MPRKSKKSQNEKPSTRYENPWSMFGPYVFHIPAGPGYHCVDIDLQDTGCDMVIGRLFIGDPTGLAKRHLMLRAVLIEEENALEVANVPASVLDLSSPFVAKPLFRPARIKREGRIVIVFHNLGKEKMGITVEGNYMPFDRHSKDWWLEKMVVRYGLEARTVVGPESTETFFVDRGRLFNAETKPKK